MKFYNLKNKQHFKLSGSIALAEEGFNRFNINDREFIKKINPSVSILSTHSSGISAKFETNSKLITVNVELDAPAYMSHMTAVGQCGLDLYVYDERKKEYIFHKASIYDFKETKFTYDLGVFETKKNRKIWINLPLYMGVKNIEIGIEDNSYAIPHDFTNNKKIIFYGTSITQGATASRPGMSHTNLLSRWLDAEIFNFGFSGSAFLENEIADIISKVENPDLIFIDVQPNAGIDDRLEKNLDNFVNRYLTYHPNVKIIIASRIYYSVDLFVKDKLKIRKYYEKFIKDYVLEKQKTNKNIYYLDGSKVFGKNFHEKTVDGVHPNDLGSMEMAKYYYKEIKKII